MLSFVLLLSCACGPKMGLLGGPIFGNVFKFIFVKFFASGLKWRNGLVEIRSTTQATRNEDNRSAAEDHDAYKTLNGKKLSSS